MNRKNNLRTGLLTAIGLLLCLSACNVRRPEMVLSNRKMAEVLYDYHMARSVIKNKGAANDSIRQSYMNYVFEKHHVTEEVFDSSLSWFSHNPEAMMNVYDRVFTKMNAENENVKSRIAERDNKITASLNADTLDIWPERKLLRLSSRPFEKLITFTLDNANYYKEKDTLRWSIDYHFMNGEPDSAKAVVMMMQVWYDKDSMVSEIRNILKDGLQEITLQNDTFGKIKSVQGFLYYPKQQDTTKFVLLDKISLLRIHAERQRSSIDTISSTRGIPKPQAIEATSEEETSETETFEPESAPEE